MTTNILDYLKTLPQYILPHHFLSRLVFYATRSQWRPWKNLLIKYFIRLYRVDMNIAKQADYRQYSSFNHFFTRELNNDARPIVADIECIASPVDGTISQTGLISDTDIFQAKGRLFNLTALLAAKPELSNYFRNGCFATLYLSPRDYHRIHMPIDGQLEEMIYVPGRLFAVNNSAARNIDQLFCRNERLIKIFDTVIGKMAIISVGALFVGSMETVWAGQITPARKREISHWHYQHTGQNISLSKGEELARFNMGSTVILLFGPGRIEWSQALQPESPVKMGATLGKIIIKHGATEDTEK